MIKERRVQVLRSSPFFPPIQVLTRNHLWYHSRDFPWGQFFHLLNPKSTYSLQSGIASTIDSLKPWAIQASGLTGTLKLAAPRTLTQSCGRRHLGSMAWQMRTEQSPSRDSMEPPSIAEHIKRTNTGKTGRSERSES